MDNIWIRGNSLSGKSGYLVEQFGRLARSDRPRSPKSVGKLDNSVLVFSVDAEAQKKLSDRLSSATDTKSFTAVTPLSFFRNEVILFFPLLIAKLNLQAQFPILLRVENEQELATNLWAERLDRDLTMEGVNNARLVRRILDLYLLAAYSNKKLEDLPQMLTDSIEVSNEVFSESGNDDRASIWDEIGMALIDWRNFCWERGLLTYGIITELFGRYLLPDPKYQASLKKRYQYLLMDDIDEYPAIACELSLVMLNQGATGIFTFNPNGSTRLGLGADPEYWRSQVESICTLVSLSPKPNPLAESSLETILDIASNDDPFYIPNIPDRIEGFINIETRSRGSLLRTVAEVIAQAIAAREIRPHEIAIIAPGLDNIASYALHEILTKKDIPIVSLSDRHPLSNSSQVRSLLTLLTLVYSHLGHLVTRDRVAEMLVNLDPAIDPVRAGMLSDRCFVPHISNPQLLPSQAFNEWHRLGYEATTAYEQIRNWITPDLRSLPTLVLLDRAIQRFMAPQKLGYEQLSNLQALLETAQYYWQIGYRLGWQEHQILIGFIELIRTGIVTANPQTSNSGSENSVTLSTIYQYRMIHTQHRWQFWLDIGSPLWLQGGSAALFAAPIFLQDWAYGNSLLTSDYENTMNKQRLQRLLRDLLDRTYQTIYLCYSELNTAGQEQMGDLTALKDIASL